MRDFAIGLGLGLLGCILWIIASVIGGLAEGSQEALGATEDTEDLVTVMEVFMYLGFAVMLLGPATFWIFLPFGKLMRRLWTRR